MVQTTEYRVELKFDTKPSQDILQGLKICGWKWDSKRFCWYNKKNEENLTMARSIDESVNASKEPKQEIPKPTIKLNMNNIIVRTNGFYCNANHWVIDIKGHLDIIDKHGKVKEKLVSLAFCANCNTFFILEETYSELKKQGIICGIIMTKKEYAEHKDLNTAYWKEKSPLRLCGYSVSKAEGLSVEQRWAILERVVDTGIMTLDKELSYLDFFINWHSNEDSIYCWKQDRKHMEGYVSHYSGHVLLT